MATFATMEPLFSWLQIPWTSTVSQEPLSGRFLCYNEKIADKLPGWKAATMNSAGRAALVRAVLTAISIYQLIALDFPK
jgi:hypothetical protein